MVTPPTHTLRCSPLSSSVPPFAHLPLILCFRRVDKAKGIRPDDVSSTDIDAMRRQVARLLSAQGHTNVKARRTRQDRMCTRACASSRLRWAGGATLAPLTRGAPCSIRR